MIDTKKITNVDADRLASSLLRTAERLFEDPRIQAEFISIHAARVGCDHIGAPIGCTAC